MAKEFLNKAGIEYEVVLAEENAELCKEYAIKEAPTLVMLSDAGASKISGPSDIKKFCEKAVKA
jgi:ribonucleoside-triphosphate reductase